MTSPARTEGERLESELLAVLGADRRGVPPEERAAGLLADASRLKQRPIALERLRAAIALCDEAAAVCPPEHALLRARLMLCKADALQSLPGEGFASLRWARTAYEIGLPTLRRLASPDEAARAEMRYAVVLEALALSGQLPIGDALQAFSRALRVFDREPARYARELAIVQDNLANVSPVRRKSEPASQPSMASWP